MILHSDAAQLEWRSYLELSQDWVGIRELQEGQDVHTNNKERFSLPTRLVSKTFLFRWIYRGSAYAYSVDNDFMPVSKDPDYWQRVIDAANEKYNILYKFQEQVIQMAKEYKVITIPTGREFLFELSKNYKDEYYWDIKKIVNYINQGFGADIMMMVRFLLRRKLFKSYHPDLFTLMNTIHDSIDVDVDNDPELLYNICIDTEESYSKVPEFFTQYYGKPFHTPIKGEVYFGMNLKELVPFDRSKGKEQFLCLLKS